MALLSKSSAGSVIGGLVLLAAALIASVSTGTLRVPLPAPAHGKYVHLVPQGVLPWKPSPLKGVFAPNQRLLEAVKLFEGQIQGAESVTFAASGNLVMADKFGGVYEAFLESGCGNGRGSATVGDGSAAAGSDGAVSVSNASISFVFNPEPVTHLGNGRPLGFHYDHEDNLVVCDSLKGVLKYDAATRELNVLTNRVSPSSPLDANTEVTYPNDLAIGSDGRVYFTSCSDVVPARNAAGYYDTLQAWMLGMAQGLPKGRLMMYDPATTETVVLAKGFWYANGVALAPDESYLVVAETDRIRLMKHWLKGPKAGTSEPLLENLPGAPDGVSTAPDGAFWVGLVSPIPPIARLLRDPTVRAIYAWLPGWARPPLKKWGAVLKVSGSGEVLDWLMDPAGAHVHTVSSAVEHDGCLFLGNLAGDSVSYVDLGIDGSTADGACMCRCKCGGVELPLPVRLLPPKRPGEEQQQAGEEQQQQQEQQEQEQQAQEEDEEAAPQAPPAPDGLHSEL